MNASNPAPPPSTVPSPGRGARSRVLLVGEAAFDSVIDSYARALVAHYDVRVVDPFRLSGLVGRAVGPARAYRLAAARRTIARVLFREPLAFAERSIEREAARFAPDLVLVTCIDALRPAVVAKLRAGNARARVFGVFSDSIANFGRGYFFAADYDALFFKDRYIVDKLRAKLGWTHVRYLPQACDRVLHRRVPLTPQDEALYGCDIGLAGNPYLYRNECLRPLVGRSMKIWGQPPPAWVDHPTRPHFTGRYVAGVEKCKAMLAAKIVLNQNFYAEIAGTNKRTFEVAAIGAFQLTDTPALAEVFDPEAEVAAYDTRAEMIERIDYFLARPELRAAMAARAERRAHTEHTYEHRWAAHLEALGLEPPPGFPVRVADLAVRAR